MRCAYHSCRDDPSFTRHQVLTGLRPFHHLGPYAVVIAAQKGERPRKPETAESLGLSGPLWRLIRKCWSKSPSARPTAQQLLRHLEVASRTWVPPHEYPIPNDLGGGVGLDLTSDDGRSIVTSVLTSSLFVLTLGVLCILFLPSA